MKAATKKSKSQNIDETLFNNFCSQSERLRRVLRAMQRTWERVAADCVSAAGGTMEREEVLDVVFDGLRQELAWGPDGLDDYEAFEALTHGAQVRVACLQFKHRRYCM
jgi:hypothetical protein